MGMSDGLGLVDPSICPVCGNLREVFEWGVIGNTHFSCIDCAREEHYMLFPENRPTNKKAEDD
jgi:hypothetical protein